MHALLIGNFGVGNLGDEALREYFLSAFPDVDWTVVSAHPRTEHEVARLPGGVASLLAFRWVRTLRAYRHTDVIVFGGGSLFTDIESTYACFLWWLHTAAARFYRKPVLFAFQGIGPLRSRAGEWFARRALRKAAFLSVRDDVSADRIADWGLNIPVVRSFDPVFLLLQKEKRDDHRKNVLIVIPRKNSGATFRERAKELVASGLFETLRILSMEPENEAEASVCRSLAAALGAEVTAITTLTALAEAVSGSSLVLSQRYHGALAALASGIPVEVVPQGVGDKMAELQELKPEDAPRLLDLVQTGEEALREMLQRL
ncbi:MAG: polysaccharide pyruvyl transferase CsaB [Candidatus Peregrinibacteria bacterium Greene0416_19]|nr:MAG: polysaccharide pyruvyl transferase CsaB [Candidatus Peregrinibacteria bacterium Greene0416_19]